MATFRANPNGENDPWIEKAAIEGLGFRNWHLLFFCFTGICTVLVLLCCCIKFRIPRTKQEIEADYQRKKITDKFRQRLKLINNDAMESVDLQKVLEIIQDDCKEQNKKVDLDRYFTENAGNSSKTNEEMKNITPTTPSDVFK